MKLFPVAVLVACSACAPPTPRAPADAPAGAGVERASRSPPASTVVERVVDGDTIVVRAGAGRSRVRLIGVDAPETHPRTPVQCYGPEASDFLDRTLAGRRVDLVLDADRFDRYGRTLAYVYRNDDGLFVNLAAVAGGYAVVLTVPPNVAHVRDFVTAERTARAARLGLWGACV